jgi:hypothetical protein
MVKAESRRLIEVPAQYETTTETYEAEPASKTVTTMAPRFETVSETIVVQPASTKWVKKSASQNCLSANPDDCLVWCLVEVPEEKKTITKQVNKGCDNSGVANSGCVKETPIPAKMATRTVTRVKVPAGTREEAVPAEYKTVTKQVVKTPESTREEVTPAEYRTVTKQVVKVPASTREEVIPAEYSTITKQVLKTPASTREEVVPAQYATVTKQVVKTPAQYREETIPAQYSSVSKKEITTPAGSREVAVPAEYATITKRVLKKAGGMAEWREVVCDGTLRTETGNIRKLQEKLKKLGYDPGPIDNVMGTQTKEALVKYQKDKGLPVGNLNIETVKSLGLDF